MTLNHRLIGGLPGRIAASLVLSCCVVCQMRDVPVAEKFVGIALSPENKLRYEMTKVLNQTASHLNSSMIRTVVSNHIRNANNQAKTTAATTIRRPNNRFAGKNSTLFAMGSNSIAKIARTPVNHQLNRDAATPDRFRYQLIQENTFDSQSSPFFPGTFATIPASDVWVPRPTSIPRSALLTRCQGKTGYIADADHSCQTFFNCMPDGSFDKLSCPAGLVFDQETLSCQKPAKTACSTEKIFDCNGKAGFFADPFSIDRSSYFFCINGKKTHFRCPEGLFFNENCGACDLPQNCGPVSPASYVLSGPFSRQPAQSFEAPAQSIPARADLSAIAENSQNSVSDGSRQMADLASESSTTGTSTTAGTNPLTANGFDCSGRYGLFADVSSGCTSYWVCMPTGAKHLLQCPAQLRFNELLGSCDFPERVNCNPLLVGGGSFCVDKIGFYPDPSSNCKSYFFCSSDGKTYNFTCPGILLYNEIIGACDDPHNVDCLTNRQVDDFDCAGKVGLFADVNQGCRVYYNCNAYGKRTRLQCPNGQIFNERMGVCDLEHTVSCGRLPSLLATLEPGNFLESRVGNFPNMPLINTLEFPNQQLEPLQSPLSAQPFPNNDPSITQFQERNQIPNIFNQINQQQFGFQSDMPIREQAIPMGSPPSFPFETRQTQMPMQPNQQFFGAQENNFQPPPFNQNLNQNFNQNQPSMPPSIQPAQGVIMPNQQAPGPQNNQPMMNNQQPFRFEPQQNQQVDFEARFQQPNQNQVNFQQPMNFPPSNQPEMPQQFLPNVNSPPNQQTQITDFAINTDSQAKQMNLPNGNTNGNLQPPIPDMPVGQPLQPPPPQQPPQGQNQPFPNVNSSFQQVGVPNVFLNTANPDGRQQQVFAPAAAQPSRDIPFGQSQPTNTAFDGQFLAGRQQEFSVPNNNVQPLQPLQPAQTFNIPEANIAPTNIGPNQLPIGSTFQQAGNVNAAAMPQDGFQENQQIGFAQRGHESVGFNLLDAAQNLQQQASVQANTGNGYFAPLAQESGYGTSVSGLGGGLGTEGFDCRGHIGYFADLKEDCRAYYYCKADGTKVQFRCPGDLKYNASLGVCDWARNVHCAVQGTGPGNTPTWNDNSFFDCQGRSGFFGDSAREYRVFYYCETDGRKHRFVCPSNLRFNDAKGACDWQENLFKGPYVGEQEFDCTGKRGYFGNPSTPSVYYFCHSDGTTTKHVCPDNLIFNFQIGSCDWPERLNANSDTYGPAARNLNPFAGRETAIGLSINPLEIQAQESALRTSMLKAASNAFKCDAGRYGFFADVSTNCRKYFYCRVDGKNFSFSCPNNLRFNEKLGACDLERNVPCLHSSPPGFAQISVSKTYFDCNGKVGLTTDPEDSCRTFYNCEPDGSFVTFACSDGLAFNSVIGACDKASRVQCKTKDKLLGKNKIKV